MATSYSTPGVYVQEISTLPPSVAAVSTAIPAFIGYTEKGPKGKPTRISTLLEYEQIFGGPPEVVQAVGFDLEGGVAVSMAPSFPQLYYSLRLYFDNGGGACYIVSTGPYGDLALDDFKGALDALKKEDEPTLIVMPDATRLSGPTDPSAKRDYVIAYEAALQHCGTMGDRFAILDVAPGQDKDAAKQAFRAVSSDYLSYGAAYTPFLRTSIASAYAADRVPVGQAFGNLLVRFDKASDKVPKVKITGSNAQTSFALEAANLVLTISVNTAKSTATDIVKAWIDWAKAAPGLGSGFRLSVVSYAASSDSVPLTDGDQPVELPPATLDKLASSNSAQFNQVKAALASQRVTLPPSGAIAGIYARVDRERGVWKAPANVAVASTLDLEHAFTNEEQGLLNVDPVGGRSINVIRSFTGRGILVWGSRTLAGNDNEWRYVPVRRLFIMIEESAQKATAFAVFEPNDATTWLKVKAMIESFLYGLWEQGALAGSKPEDAYFVHVGLGHTMTPQDILEGRMNVEIGVAAVRPAEFIVLKFTHKLQQS